MEYSAMIPAFHTVSSRQRPITTDDLWQTFFFKVYGKTIPESRAVCPKTVRLIDQIPGAETAMFSILKPGKTPAVLPKHIRQPGNAADGKSCHVQSLPGQ